MENLEVKLDPRITSQAFHDLCEQAEELGERLNHELDDYPAYSSIMDAISKAQIERIGLIAMALPEEHPGTKWDRLKVGCFHQDWAYVQQGPTLYDIRRENDQFKIKLKRGPDIVDHEEIRRMVAKELRLDHPHYQTRVRAAGRNPDKEIEHSNQKA